MENLSRATQTDFKFRQYVERHLRRGDKGKLQGLLAMSYPTLKLHLSGVYVNPAIQSQVIEFFERRKRAEKLASQYVSQRIEGLADVPVEMPGLTPGSTPAAFLANFVDDEK